MRQKAAGSTGYEKRIDNYSLNLADFRGSVIGYSSATGRLQRLMTGKFERESALRAFLWSSCRCVASTLEFLRDTNCSTGANDPESRLNSMKSPTAYGHIQHYIRINDDEASAGKGQFATPSEGKGIRLDASISVVLLTCTDKTSLPDIVKGEHHGHVDVKTQLTTAPYPFQLKVLLVALDIFHNKNPDEGFLQAS